MSPRSYYLFALALLACNNAPPPPDTSTTSTTQIAAAGAVQRLGPAEFKKTAEQSQGLYLDVRTPGEVARGQITGASNIDVNDPRFDQKVKVLDRHRPLFVYCASGGRSRAASDKLAKMGFEHVYDLSGGMGAWTRAGMPVELPTNAGPAAPGMTLEAFDAELKAPVVLVDFQTPWCSPCKTMAPIVDDLAHTYAGRAKVLRVDVDASEAVAAREKVEGVPVFALYVKGHETWRTSGVTAREALAQKLDAALAPVH
jgi:thioredoxin 1